MGMTRLEVLEEFVAGLATQRYAGDCGISDDQFNEGEEHEWLRQIVLEAQELVAAVRGCPGCGSTCGVNDCPVCAGKSPCHICKWEVCRWEG